MGIERIGIKRRTVMVNRTITAIFDSCTPTGRLLVREVGVEQGTSMWWMA